MDTISRQAAIDMVRKCRVIEVTPAYMLIDKKEAVSKLVMLPPAQPEIIRCKYCRYWEEIMTGKGHCKDMYRFGRWWKDSDFCSNAKRKEDGSDGQSAYRKYFEDLSKNNPEQAKKEATNELIKMGLLNSDGSTKETIVSI